jgi:hypothetical protein
MWTGRCLCEGVRYEVTGKLAPIGFCHCKQCQRASGSAFSCNTTVAKSDFRLVSGAELLREFESSPGRFRVFCSRCGSPVYKRVAARAHLGEREGAVVRDHRLAAPARRRAAAQAVAPQLRRTV